MIQRSQTADLLKGIAVLLMIQVHIVELFANVEMFSSNKGRFLLFLGGPIVAPIFLVILGYFIACSNKSIKELVARGVKIFLIGMLLNLGLNFNLLWHVYLGKINVDIWPYVFGVDVLQFAGIAIVIFAGLKHILYKTIFVSLGLSVIVAFLGHYLRAYKIDGFNLEYITSFFYGSTHWSYFPVFPWIAYPLLGFAFFQWKQNYSLETLLKPYFKKALGILFVLFLFFTGGYAISVSSNLQEYYHHGLLFFIWTFFFLIFYGLFVHEVDTKIGQSSFLKYIKWVGKNVTVIYIIQWLLIGNIATAIYRSVSSPLILVLSFCGILFASTFLTHLYLKLK